MRCLWFPASDRLRILLIPSGTTRPRKDYEFTIVWHNLSPFHHFLYFVLSFKKKRAWQRVSTIRGGTRAGCVRQWLTRDIAKYNLRLLQNISTHTPHSLRKRVRTIVPARDGSSWRLSFRKRALRMHYSLSLNEPPLGEVQPNNPFFISFSLCRATQWRPGF